MAGLVFDREKLRFRSEGGWLRAVLRTGGRYLLTAIPLSLVIFGIFAFFITTDEDRRLSAENEAYEARYEELLAEKNLLTGEVRYLTLRDNAIYRSLFYNDAPPPSLSADADLVHVSDTISDENILRHTAARIDRSEKAAASVRENLDEIARILIEAGGTSLPMSLPLRDISLAQIGASTGEKVNPFYKVGFPHYGLDVTVMQGTPVFATADGTVLEATVSRKGLGNVIEISHPGGYTTVYGHLGEISVSKGQKVSRGQQIGTSGLSGNSFAPHLHYEVRRDSLVLDPTGYLFADLTPKTYTNVLYISEHTGQSLD